ncbi:MAG TPA: phosphatase PAP2 family protein [Gaiellaceae bacterium]|nr:phosphatase PAP2 family protein [Gaiellaceae bacterium]
MVLASIDDRIVEWVAAHRFALLNGFFTALGTVEKLGAIWVLLSFVVGLLMRRGVWAAVGLAALTAATTLAADGASFVVKDLVHRARPFEAHPQIHPLYVVHSSSFPAGHAATAFAGATLLSYLAPRLAPLFVGLAAAIGFSRIYVGVHYPTDVLAGALIGIVVGAAAIGVVLLVEKKWKPRAVTGGRQPIHAS